MKYYIIAGEASGDLHGSNLIKEIKKADQKADFRVWGGDKMENAGATLVKHYKSHSIMGIIPVIMNLRTIKANFKFCYTDIVNYKPDAVIFIDYSGFNLRVAKMVKPLGMKLFYYVSPQVWAWRKGRVKKIKLLIDKLFSILPFEKEFYKQYDYEVDYVGHPLLDSVSQFLESESKSLFEFSEKNGLNNKPIIAILPGSRFQEIKEKLPEMLSVVKDFPNHQFLIAAAPSIEESYYKQFIPANSDVKLLFNQTYNILEHSVAALVTSGTATLETAIFNVPQVVCYRGNKATYFVVKYLVDIKYISIVNLIMDKQVVLELIQNDLNYVNVKNELSKLLFDNEYIAKMKEDYTNLTQKLGGVGASERAANIMVNYLREK